MHMKLTLPLLAVLAATLAVADARALQEGDPTPSPVDATAIPTSEPLDVPETPVEDAESDAPSDVPSSAPTFLDKIGAQCSAHAGCAALELADDCCPTVDGWMLDCCKDVPPVEVSCDANPMCNDLGLEGACCPTEENWILDCCEPIPSVCGQTGSSCTVVSAAEYLENPSQFQQFTSSAAPAHFLLALVGSLVLAMRM